HDEAHRAHRREQTQHPQQPQHAQHGGFGTRRDERDHDHEEVEQVPAVEEEAPPIRVDAQHDLDDEDRDDDAADEVERLARTLHHDWVGLEPEDHGIDDDEPDDAALERLRLDEFAHATAQARSRSADNGGGLRRGGGHDRKHYGDQAS